MVSHVEQKRPRADTGVETAVGVAPEREPTDRGISYAGGEVKKGVLSLSGVESGIAAIRRWDNRLRNWGKREASHRKQIKNDISIFHECDFLSVFWPSLSFSGEVVSGRSLMYFVIFGGALRGKCGNLKNHGLRGCHGYGFFKQKETKAAKVAGD